MSLSEWKVDLVAERTIWDRYQREQEEFCKNGWAGWNDEEIREREGRKWRRELERVKERLCKALEKFGKYGPRTMMQNCCGGKPWGYSKMRNCSCAFAEQLRELHERYISFIKILSEQEYICNSACCRLSDFHNGHMYE